MSNNEKSLKNLIKENIENGTDFEFYPTTREIIEAMYWDLIPKKHDESIYRSNGLSFDFLDIGSGNCKLRTIFKEIANEQPLLDEYYYYPIKNREFYENATPIKIVDVCGQYSNDYEVIYLHENEEITKKSELSQFMLSMKNTSIEKVDLNNLDYTKEGHGLSRKGLLLEKMEDYHFPRTSRCESERQANRVFIKKYMCIEKSQTLINAMPKDVFVVGTDFHENFLVDKKADIVFCNPPYSEYVQWTARIINEANANYIYLVIPQRWGNSQGIKKAIKDRKARVKIVGNFSFENAEDRKARANVSLVRICLKPKIKHKLKDETFEGEPIDPFEKWIEDTFDFSSALNKELDDWEKRKQERTNLKNQLIDATDLVSALVELYNKEMEKLINNYKAVTELDAEVLKELNISIDSLKAGLRQKIVGLKHRYWLEIFDNLGDIKKRLIKRSRDSLVSILNSQTNIDFTKSNVRAVVIWVIKNANQYYDSQMLTVYDDFTTEEGITLYKSNQRFKTDDFRSLKNDKKLEKYALDYRLVKHGYLDDFDKQYRENISSKQIDSMEDIEVIARNLGFTIAPHHIDYDDEDADNSHKKCSVTNIPFNDIKRGAKYDLHFNIAPGRLFKKGTKTQIGKIKSVYCHTNIPNENKKRVQEIDGIEHVFDKDNKTIWYQYLLDDGAYYHQDRITVAEDVFTTVKGYQNGNVHYQFNKKFMKKFNLEVGRLRGWIKSPSEAAEEFDITLDEANEYWESNFKVLPSTVQNLLPNYKKDEEVDIKPDKYEVDDIENGELGLFKNDELIFKSSKGAILSCTNLNLDDLPCDCRKSFMDSVYNNSIDCDENKLTIEANLEITDTQPYSLENKNSDDFATDNESDVLYSDEQKNAFKNGSLF